MSISLVSASTERFASAIILTPSEPADVMENDVMVALCLIDSDDGSWDPAVGWTEIDDQTEAIATQHWWFGFIKRGASTPDLRWDYSGTADDIRVTIWAFRGVDAAALDVTWVLGSHYATEIDTSVSSNQPITTNTDNSLVLLVDATLFQGAQTPGAPSGYTLESTGFGSDPQMPAAYKIVPTAGTETPTDWTHSGYSSGADHLMWTIALKPFVSAVPVFVHHRKLLGMS